eukprot:2719842-Rhodomonas_salina.3
MPSAPHRDSMHRSCRVQNSGLDKITYRITVALPELAGFVKSTLGPESLLRCDPLSLRKALRGGVPDLVGPVHLEWILQMSALRSSMPGCSDGTWPRSAPAPLYGWLSAGSDQSTMRS